METSAACGFANQHARFREAASGKRSTIKILPQLDHPISPNHWRGLLIIAVATISMLAWSWQTWCDPLVDFGKQLYVPWQMNQGTVIYRDMAYYSGPLSQYIDAGLCLLLGMSLRTLVLGNLAVLVGVLILIYRLALTAGGRIAATMCCLTFVLMFAFGQGVPVANYNWVTPYTTEITHGIALGLLSIALMHRYLRSCHWFWLACCGMAVGLVFLTRPEPFMAALPAVTLMLLSGAWIERWSPPQICRSIAILLLFGVAVVLTAFGLMCVQMPPSTAAIGVAGAWPWMFDPRVTALPFYRRISGTDDITGNLITICMWTIIYTGVLIAVAWAALRMKRQSRSAAVIAFVIGVVMVAIVFNHVDWNSMIRPLPIFLLMIACAAVMPILRRTWPSDVLMLRIGLIAFALALLLKIALNAQVSHYGFALAMPGMLVVVATAAMVPAWVKQRGGNGALMSAILGLVWIVLVGVTLYVDHLMFAGRTFTLGQGGDAFRIDSRDLDVKSLVDEIKQDTPVDSTLMVLPQGLMVNYLARRASPIPYLNFMPPEVLAAGEDRILAAFVAHPPDFVVVDTSSVDRGSFTMDHSYSYGRKTLDWVRANYQPAVLVGAAPTGPLMRLVLLARKR